MAGAAASTNVNSVPAIIPGKQSKKRRKTFRKIIMAAKKPNRAFNREDYQETSSGWGCPHELAGECKLIRQPCQPGVRGCILYRRMKNPEQDQRE